MYENLLDEYKKLPEEVKHDLNILDGFNTCYMRDKNMADEMVIIITRLAKECWLDDEYSSASVSSYVDYLLDGVYEYGATKKELEELYSKDIVEAYNTNLSIEDVLTFDTSDYQYSFETKDGFKYFSSPDGFYIINENGRCVSEPHPMADELYDVFALLKDDKISFITKPMHYNIRCMIKYDILGDNELEEMYKDGIDNYKKYCLKYNITSEDILKDTELDEDISLTELDGVYTKLNKMEKLANYYHNIHADGNNYTYVASLDNGNDYYYRKGSYLALDKNNVVKEFKDKKHFLLNELKDKSNFAYISDNEMERIESDLKEDYKNVMNNDKDNIFKKDNISPLVKFVNYQYRKEIKPLDKDFVSSLSKYLFTLNATRKAYEKSISKTQEYKDLEM